MCIYIYIYMYIYIYVYIYIYAWCILHQVFSHPPCQNKATCLLADQSWDSEGYFTWPAWWIEFIGRFTLAFLWRLRIWVVVHDPNRNFLSRNFFGRSLRGKGVWKAQEENLLSWRCMNILCIIVYIYIIIYIYIYILYLCHNNSGSLWHFWCWSRFRDN